MKFTEFSPKQLKVLRWWCEDNDRDGIICDGAVRSGKTLCMSVSFAAWAMMCFDGRNFAICGKTIRSVKRNVVTTLIAVLIWVSRCMTDSPQIRWMYVQAAESTPFICLAVVMKAPPH